MIGAGVFVVFAPAAAAAGSGLLVGLAIAAVVAYCNATSSARLAARYPQSGGTYVYGRERLGQFWGYLAGWSFVVGKTASCAAMALTVGLYLLAGHAHAVAVAAVVGADRGELPRHSEVGRADPGDRGRHAARCWPVWSAVVAFSGAARPVQLGCRLAQRQRRPGCCRRPDCCSSPSPATRASPPSVRRLRDPARTIPARDPHRAGDHTGGLRRGCGEPAGGAGSRAAGIVARRRWPTR